MPSPAFWTGCPAMRMPAADSADPSASWPRRLQWRVESGAVHGWLGACRALPPARASALGARIGASLGPRIPYSRRARQNMQIALPDLDAAGRARLLRAMWANLGRLGAEYAHLPRLSDPDAGYVEIRGLAHLRDTMAGARPAVAAAAHLANFEVLHVLLARLVPRCLTIVRAPNNPRVADPLDALRRAGGGATSPKGLQGARDSMQVLAQNGLVIMLADQRMSDGVQADFFGHTAGTPAGPAQMAQRYGAPLLPTRMERVGPVAFRLTIEPPLPEPAAGDARARRAAWTAALNRRFEAWIRERPADWLWLHRRWPRAVYADLA